jgi:hypothetical protein
MQLTGLAKRFDRQRCHKTSVRTILPMSDQFSYSSYMMYGVLLKSDIPYKRAFLSDHACYLQSGNIDAWVNDAAKSVIIIPSLL